MDIIYDLVIVGGGPAGLALATYCSKMNKKIIIIEKEDDIGGCHRVRRIKHNNELIFTEHGPRIYSSSYLNLISLLKEMNVDFYDLFTPYNFTMSAIGGETLWSTLTNKELFYLFIEFVYLILNDSHGQNISMNDFTSKNNFKTTSIDMIDKLCRLTDGADINRYTLNEFLNLFNQQSLYNIYQPKLPNDIGLFNIWKTYLINNNVTFLLSSNVDKLILNESNEIKSVNVNGELNIKGKQFIIATPPLNLVKILQSSDNLNAFGDIDAWSQKTAYIDYLSITFHWDKKLNLPKVYGFPKSEWGIAYIVLTDYMKFNEQSSQTVISIAITITDKPNHLNKTANQCSKDELINEVYNQLLYSYPNLPLPTLSILSPGVQYDSINKKWVSYDTAYISSSLDQTKLPFNSNTINNLYNLGTHNGKSKYSFTSMEAAVSNALELSYILYPELKNVYPYKYGYTIRSIILMISFILIIFLIYRNY